MLYWGGHAAYDAGADRPCGSDNHELKSLYPYYELMQEVNPQATKKFIEAFWSAHILDWANLEMNRHGSIRGTLKKPWDYEYKGGPVFFEGKGISFSVAGSDLSYGAVMLTKLSGEKSPLDWAKRLSHRYVETRNPDVGISSYTYNRNTPSPLQDLLGDDFKRDLLVYGMEFPGNWHIVITAPQICQLLLGEILGDEGMEFTQWTLEELTAWGRVAYRKEDNSFIPMLIDGTNLERYVLKKNSDCGPKGTVVKSTPADSSVFFLYALAYRTTENNFMWEMTRSIAKGNDFGDIGKTVKNKPQLRMSTDCSEFYALMGFLELYKKTKDEAFLNIAKVLGDNILSKRFHKGFFAPSAKHIYASFNVIESLSLLHLDAVINSRSMLIPEMWPSWYFFEFEYRRIGMQRDEEIIYPLTESVEPPISLFEAAAMGDLDSVKTLVSSGADVNATGPAFFSTPLHEAVKGRHTNIVQFLISNGADVNARGGSYRLETALHHASERGYTDIVGLLITAGADINADNSLGDKPLQYAACADNKDIVELLLQKGATIANLHIASYMGDLEKAEAFINEGIDINALDGSGYAPLHYAAQNNQKQSVELLIAKGADVNVKNWGGQTPLDIAIDQRYKDIAKLLISKGADVNATDNRRDTVLHRAVEKNREDLVAFLIDIGADMNVQNDIDEMPLGTAVRRERKDIAELLISKGADVNAINNKGETILHSVVKNGRKGMTEFLIDKGADINIKNKSGQTALDIAVLRGYTEIAEILRKHGAKEEEEEKAPESAPAPKEDKPVDPNAVGLKEPDSAGCFVRGGGPPRSSVLSDLF